MYKEIVRPLLFRLDPEQAHNLVKKVGRIVQVLPPLGFLLEKYFRVDSPLLEQELLGRKFANPLGLAAGFDKNAQLLEFFSYLGFGFMEVGSVTAQPWEGNPQPRLFRLPEDEALLNRMGLNNDGCDEIVSRLRNNIYRPHLPLGTNITKTPHPAIVGEKAIEDFVYSYRHLRLVSDYAVLNISCPNTLEGKTFEDLGLFRELMTELKYARLADQFPLLVKLSPDLEPKRLENLLMVGSFYDVDGYVVCNTTAKRENLQTSSNQVAELGKGGLSGQPLRVQATKMLRRVYEMTKGEVLLIGVGGINSAESAYERIKAGASLVQVYTGLIYEGPALAKRINSGLVELLKHDGFDNISEAVGTEKK